jgi:uncharacterized spore protein YtfJ
MQSIEKLVEEITKQLGEIAQSDIVVGQPVAVGGVTAVPISRISVGFGGGGGQGEGNPHDHKHAADKDKSRRGKGIGGGSGGGAKVRPMAVAVFSDAGVEILPIGEKKGKLEALLERIPDWVEQFKKKADHDKSGCGCGCD